MKTCSCCGKLVSYMQEERGERGEVLCYACASGKTEPGEDEEVTRDDW